MSGFESSPTPAFLLDLEMLRRVQRAERDLSIRAEADKQRIGIEKLRRTGVLKGDDMLFHGHTDTSATTAASAPATTAEPDSAAARKAVFDALRSGASPDGLDTRFVADYQRSKEALGWR